MSARTKWVTIFWLSFCLFGLWVVRVLWCFSDNAQSSWLWSLLPCVSDEVLSFVLLLKKTKKTLQVCVCAGHLVPLLVFMCVCACVCGCQTEHRIKVCLCGCSWELSNQYNLQISRLKRPECKSLNLSSILTHKVIHVLFATPLTGVCAENLIPFGFCSMWVTAVAHGSTPLSQNLTL